MSVIEVPDLDENEIWGFLDFKLNADTISTRKNELVDVVNNITGGRILNLNMVVDAVNENKNFSKVFDEILEMAKTDFKNLEILTESKYDKFWTLIEKLLTKKFVTDDEAIVLLTGNLYNEMRKSNVFAYHKTDNTITFQSVAHETVAKKKLSERKKTFFNFITNIPTALTFFNVVTAASVCAVVLLRKN